MEIYFYRTKMQAAWDAFIEAHRAAFIFKRGFMEYHSQRFTDSSLLVYDHGNIVALLPANKIGDVLYSHKGLSFGGFIYQKGLSQPKVLAIWEASLRFLTEKGLNSIIYKALPTYQAQNFSDTDALPLFYAKAFLQYREVSQVWMGSPHFQLRRKRGVKKASKAGLVFSDKWEGLDAFWDILKHTLFHRHAATPVHTLAEISGLQQKFPYNIRFCSVRRSNGQLVSGAVIFCYPYCWHVQYIAANAFGKQNGAPDFLIYRLMQEMPAGMRLSFGVSSLRQAQQINKGLFDWKQGWATQVFPHDTYEISTDSFYFLKNQFT